MEMGFAECVSRDLVKFLWKAMRALQISRKVPSYHSCYNQVPNNKTLPSVDPTVLAACVISPTKNYPSTRTRTTTNKIQPIFAFEKSISGC